MCKRVHEVYIEMIPVKNHHVQDLEDIKGPVFKDLYVQQIVKARDSIFNEMCEELSITNNHDIQSCYLNKRTVSKEKLSNWLETVCYILDSFSVPLLKNAVPIVERISVLQKEKIDDQEKIIKLQDEVISKNSDQLKAVKTTVETEIKSYSSVVAKSCKAALSTKKIEAAVRKAADKEDRTKNAIIYGIEESDSEVIQEKVGGILEVIGEKPLVKNCARVGVKKPGGVLPRPVKFSLSSSDLVAQVLRNARQLHSKEGYRSVYICPDRTVEERKAHKKLVDQLKEKKQSDPDKVHFIRHNNIVSIDKKVDSVEYALD